MHSNHFVCFLIWQCFSAKALRNFKPKNLYCRSPSPSFELLHVVYLLLGQLLQPEYIEGTQHLPVTDTHIPVTEMYANDAFGMCEDTTTVSPAGRPFFLFACVSRVKGGTWSIVSS